MSPGELKDEKAPFLPPLLWGLFVLVMWFWAVVGPLTVVFGILSSFVDLRGFTSVPSEQSITFGIILGTVGLCFVWLRLRGDIKFRGE